MKKEKSLLEMLAEGMKEKKRLEELEDMHWSDRHRGLIILLSILSMVGGFAFLMIMGDSLK